MSHVIFFKYTYGCSIYLSHNKSKENFFKLIEKKLCP